LKKSGKSNRSAYTILLVCLISNLIILDLCNFQSLNVVATPAVTITPGEDGDEDDAETESSEPQQEQQGEGIQPATNGKNQQAADQEYDGDYQIVIPDGAAWKETISERFNPQELTVPSGSDVTWINEDDLTHTITSGKKAGYGMYEFLQDGIFNSGELGDGESFTFHFAEPGRYEYFCAPHPWMNGVVIVQ
jgi:plastocyanin